MKHLIDFKLFEYLNVKEGDPIFNIKKQKEATFLKWQNPSKNLAFIQYEDGEKDIVRTMDLEEIDENYIDKLFKALENYSKDLSYKITRTPDGNELIKVENKIFDDPNYGDRPRFHKSTRVSHIKPQDRFYIEIIPQENELFKIKAYQGTIEKPLSKLTLQTDDKFITISNIINLLKRLSMIADDEDYIGVNKFFDDLDKMDYFTTYSTI